MELKSMPAFRLVSVFIFLMVTAIACINWARLKDSTVYEIDSDTLKCSVEPRYGYRADGKPGRELTFTFRNDYFEGEGKITVKCGRKKESLDVYFSQGLEEFKVLLPAGTGVQSACLAGIIIETEERIYKKPLTIPAFRYWEILIYPHSHVDIGYTNTHANVELIHTRNLVNGLELAKKTKDYPQGARYKWNPEVIWPVERYLSKATEEEKQIILDGIRAGYLPLDAGYVNVNTSVAGDEELFEFFRQGQEYEKITGKKIETLVQVDIPGMSWGIVPVAAKLGIKYCFAFNNGFDRVGRSTDQSFKLFWWSDAQGKNKILFLQPGSYNPGALVKGKYFWPKMAGQTDPSKLIEIVRTDHPRENFIDSYIDQKLPELEEADYYPYDIFPMSWAMADNTPIDADLPEAVRSWNGEYAYPKLRIAGATEIMREFDERYGDQIPVLKGDFTEYWTDGTGAAAKQTAQNRASKERLVQTETLWTMLKPGEPAPREEFNKAWWNILMGSEHTWCYMAPSQEPISSDILKTKFAFFDNARDQSLALLVKTLPAAESIDIAVFNNLSWKREGIVVIPADQAKGFRGVSDATGVKVKSQKLSTGELIFKAEDVPAFGSKKYWLSKEAYIPASKLVRDNVLDNGIIRVEFNPNTGDVSSLTFKGVEFVDQDAKCAINSYRYLKADDKPEKAFAPKDAKISVKENGPLLATLSVKSQAEGCNSLTSEITIYDGQENIDFKNVVDKMAILDKEGLHFGFAFDIDSPAVVADIPWGTMEVEKDQLCSANRNWITLQRWLDISNRERGVTWCPLDAPVFQVGTITANILGAATESAAWIRRLEPSATIYSWALNNHWHTNFQLSQEGEIIFRYRVRPHFNGYDYVAANRFGMEQYQPLVVARVDETFMAGQLMAIDGSPAIHSTVFKTSEDGRSAILRLRSLSDQDGTVSLKWFDRTPASIHTLDMDDDKPIEKIRDQVTIPARDFVTLKVVW
jgi:hypothetical protein